MKYVTIYEGYKPEERFCHPSDCVSRTVQDAVVDIPTLLRQFNGNLKDLFNKFNNGLLFESEIGVFVDELNEKEVAEFNRRKDEIAKIEQEKAEREAAFAEFMKERADKVAAARQAAASPQSAPAAPAAQASASE